MMEYLVISKGHFNLQEAHVKAVAFNHIAGERQAQIAFSNRGWMVVCPIDTIDEIIPESNPEYRRGWLDGLLTAIDNFNRNGKPHDS